MRDDLVQQPDPAQVRELETHIRRHFDWDGAPAMTYRNIARAVLASGLVVPTSDILGLAQQWEAEHRSGLDALMTGSDQYAAELRALTQQEPR